MHLVTHCALFWLAGKHHDHIQSLNCIEGFSCQTLLGDKGYDSDQLREYVKQYGGQPIIPPRSNRKKNIVYDVDIYKERHNIECLFGFLKHYRRIFARFDKYASRFSAFLHFAAAIQGLE